MKVNAGQDKQAKALGAGTIGFSGTATASSATSLTTSGLTSGALVGQLCVAAASGTGPTTYGVITANTTTVITVDRWYNPASPTGAAATTPSATTQFVVVPGQAPVWYMGISTDSTAPAATDTTLPSEQSTNGLGRAAATYAHTTGASSYTLSNTWTFTGSSSTTLQKIGTFDALTNGTMLHETALSATATVSASGDTVTVTQTVSM